jgi:5-formyltetrahydrofolate cyclo-ligase
LFGIVGEKMDNTKIDRINELAHKQKSVGLTEEEKIEQAALRKEYIESIRESLRANLNNISIKEADGSITDLGEKFGKKNE